MSRKLGAEFFGTFWLVLGGCGTAVFAGSNPTVGWLGVSFAFGLTVLTMAYAVGGISGGHFNPAVTLGLTVAGKFDKKDVVPYWVSQILGAVAAAAVMFAILKTSDMNIGGFATNGFGKGTGPGVSPDGYSMVAALIAEIVLTAMFLVVILGATAKTAPAGFAPIAIGLCLTLIHLISIPITNTSVNPARSISQAVFAGGASLTNLWLFIVAPLVGAALGALVWTNLIAKKD